MRFQAIISAISLAILCSCASKVVQPESVSESAPGAHPTYDDTMKWRQDQFWEEVSPGVWKSVPSSVRGLIDLEAKAPPQYTLINGQKVDPADYPAIVWIGHCTASVIGPRTLLTAAHCADNGQVLQFRSGGVLYKATATQSAKYDSADHDLALAYVDKEVKGVKYASVQIARDARQNERLMLTGYGCTKPGGGGGGNDGTLRVGYAVISSPYTKNYDLILKPKGEDKSALCFGDSGGPAFRMTGRQIAVNSKGNIEDTSYVTRTDHPDSEEFLKSWSEKNKTLICGLNLDCDQESPNPDPKPDPGQPRQFTFKNSFIELQGVVQP